MYDELLDELVSEYYLSRPNLQISNGELCVFFFACSGAGKTTTRRLLVNKLGATYVCNDEVRGLLARYPEAARQGIGLKDIVTKTVERIFTEAPNKLVIFDNNIIQYYVHADSYLNVARAHQRPIFIIGLESSESELEKRIKNRGVNVAQILSELPGQLEDYRKATDDIKPDWVLNISDDKAGLNELINLLSTTAK
jgi:gluconate kinase